MRNAKDQKRRALVCSNLFPAPTKPQSEDMINFDDVKEVEPVNCNERKCMKTRDANRRTDGYVRLNNAQPVEKLPAFTRERWAPARLLR